MVEWMWLDVICRGRLLSDRWCAIQPLDTGLQVVIEEAHSILLRIIIVEYS